MWATLSILQWATENGCDGGSHTCEAAAECGPLSPTTDGRQRMVVMGAVILVRLQLNVGHSLHPPMGDREWL